MTLLKIVTTIRKNGTKQAFCLICLDQALKFNSQLPIWDHPLFSSRNQTANKVKKSLQDQINCFKLHNWSFWETDYITEQLIPNTQPSHPRENRQSNIILANYCIATYSLNYTLVIYSTNTLYNLLLDQNWLQMEIST